MSISYSLLRTRLYAIEFFAPFLSSVHKVKPYVPVCPLALFKISREASYSELLPGLLLPPGHVSGHTLSTAFKIIRYSIIMLSISDCDIEPKAETKSLLSNTFATASLL